MSAIFTAFCPSCGGAFGSEGCSVSHDVTPASPDSGIGRIVSYRRGIRRRTAVVLGHSDLGTIVIEESGSLETTQNALDETADSAELMAVGSGGHCNTSARIRSDVVASTIPSNWGLPNQPPITGIMLGF